MRGELWVDARNELAEGPVWHDGALWWVNIPAGELHRVGVSPAGAAGGHERREIGRMLGAAVPVAGEAGRWLLAAQDGFAWLDWATGATTPILDPPARAVETRFNDGKCDPAGRFWAGTLHLRGEEDRAALYVLDGGLRVREAVSPVSLSNGLAWSGDGATMYYIDTPTRRVDAFDFDAATGAISRRRGVFDLSEQGLDGYPDGMTIDAGDRLWVATWGASAVLCIDPKSGRLVEQVRVPATQVSSCCFGGAGLDELFITTAAQGLPAEQRAAQPHAGGIFRARPGVKGRPVQPFVRSVGR